MSGILVKLTGLLEPPKPIQSGSEGRYNWVNQVILGEESDKETALKITHDSYVNDNLSRGSKADVELMKGNHARTVEEGFIYDGKVTEILSKVNMIAKVIWSVRKQLTSWVRRFSVILPNN